MDFFNLFNKKTEKTTPEIGLLAYFVTNKFTFPIRNRITYSHANVKDIKFLQQRIPRLMVVKVKHKKYNSIYKISEDEDTVIVIDEHEAKDEREIIDILFDIIKSEDKDFIERDANVIKIDFRSKK